MKVLFNVTKTVIAGAKDVAALNETAEKVDVLYMAGRFSTEEYEALTKQIEARKQALESAA